MLASRERRKRAPVHASFDWSRCSGLASRVQTCRLPCVARHFMWTMSPKDRAWLLPDCMPRAWHTRRTWKSLRKASKKPLLSNEQTCGLGRRMDKKRESLSLLEQGSIRCDGQQDKEMHVVMLSSQLTSVDSRHARGTLLWVRGERQAAQLPSPGVCLVSPLRNG